MSEKLVLNPVLCDGAGFCAEMLPERITLDDWGYPIVSTEPIDTDAVRRLAARAVRICPRHALALVEIDGQDAG